jgi:hypothetical protein
VADACEPMDSSRSVLPSTIVTRYVGDGAGTRDGNSPDGHSNNDGSHHRPDVSPVSKAGAGSPSTHGQASLSARANDRPSTEGERTVAYGGYYAREGEGGRKGAPMECFGDEQCMHVRGRGRLQQTFGERLTGVCSLLESGALSSA